MNHTFLKIIEDNKHVAYLDPSPLVEGHIRVYRKEFDEHLKSLFDLPENEFIELHLFITRVIQKLKSSSIIKCQTVSLVIIDKDIHLIPINDSSEINFSKPRIKITDERMKQLSDRISSSSSIKQN